MPDICPWCSYSLTQDDPIIKGDWWLVPEMAKYRGDIVTTAGGAHILYVIAKADGRTISGESLATRVCGEDVAAKAVHVRMHKLRRVLGDLYPIETIRRAGYRWKG